MRPIFLIGYMGCGKSTLGRMVSSLTGIDFIDLDNYIEGRYHASVSQLFAERGEHGFRDLERAMLHEVGEFEDVIVACGGGTPCFFDNMDWMNAHGTTVFLDTSTGKFIITALDGRMPHYSKAAIVFKSDLMESEKLATGRRFVEELNIH